MWEDKNRLDRYWKLDVYKQSRLHDLKQIVEDAGYILSKSPGRNLLEHRYRRIQLGQLVYDQCTTDELQQFLKARGLDAREKREVAISALHSADHRLRFPKFLDLPPELRNRVYDYYFAALPEMIRPGVQAPLTRTSSLVRKETLPIFYANTAFSLIFWTKHGEATRVLRPANDVDLFLLKTSEQSLGLLHKIQITVAGCYGRIRDEDGVGAEYTVKCCIERKPNNVVCKIRSVFGREHGFSDPERKWTPIIEQMVISEGGFSSEIIYSIRDRLKAFLWRQ